MFGGSVCRGGSLFLLIAISGVITALGTYWLQNSMNYTFSMSLGLSLVFSALFFVVVVLFDSAYKSGEFGTMMKKIRKVGKGGKSGKKRK